MERDGKMNKSLLVQALIAMALHAMGKTQPQQENKHETTQTQHSN